MSEWQIGVAWVAGGCAVSLLYHIGKKLDEAVRALWAIERAVSGRGRE